MAKPTKLLLVGNTGSGKTGALASLCAAGYSVRVLDFDNGMDILEDYLKNPTSMYVKQSPKCRENLHFVTLTDKMKNIGGKLYPATGTAWSKGMNLLDNFITKDKDGNILQKFGPITSWSENDVLVVDTLSMLSDAAMNFILSINQGLLQDRTGYTAQRDMNQAQTLVRNFLKLLYDESIKCNIVMNAHIKFMNEVSVRKTGDNNDDSSKSYGSPEGYPNSVGSALSPHIGRWFNTTLIARATGFGKHKIFTSGQDIGGVIINAKTSAPLTVKKEYPLETGLADYFKAVKGV